MVFRLAPLRPDMVWPIVDIGRKIYEAIQRLASDVEVEWRDTVARRLQPACQLDEMLTLKEDGGPVVQCLIFVPKVEFGGVDGKPAGPQRRKRILYEIEA